MDSNVLLFLILFIISIPLSIWFSHYYIKAIFRLTLILIGSWLKDKKSKPIKAPCGDIVHYIFKTPRGIFKYAVTDTRVFMQGESHILKQATKQLKQKFGNDVYLIGGRQ